MLISFVQKIWQSRSIISYLLWPFSLIYLFCYKLRIFLAKPYNSNIPVICVGNCVAGGAGKTQVVLWLLENLKYKYKNIYIISRGYKGKYKETLKVDVKKHNANLVGDEPYLLSNYANVIVSKSKVEAAKMCELNEADLIIMDDGLQNPTLTKDLKILVVDSKQKFGNGFVIPAGLCRQSVSSSIKTADIIIKIGNDNVQKIDDLNNSYNANIKIQYPAKLKGKNLFAFCAIARPSKFYNSIIEEGLELYKTKDYKDHYSYSLDDIKQLQILAKAHNLQLVTTEKDWVKIGDNYKEQIALITARLHFSDKEAILSRIVSGVLK